MFSINLTKKQYVLHLTLITVLSVVVMVAYYMCCPEQRLYGYPLIPIYFYLFGLFNIWAFDFCRRNYAKMLLTFYMGMRGGKLVISSVLALLYCVCVRHEAAHFLILFAINYIVYMIFETVFFTHYELNKKQQINNKKNNEK